MLDEGKRRKPGFRPDVPVTLADGQVWHLPKPKLTFRRSAGRIVQGAELGPSYSQVLDRYEEALDSGEGVMLAMFTLTEVLLGENYELAPDEVDTLLVIADDDENRELWRTIIGTARGQVPKTEGSDCGDDQRDY